jgi:hypothetical protein
MCATWLQAGRTRGTAASKFLVSGGLFAAYCKCWRSCILMVHAPNRCKITSWLSSFVALCVHAPVALHNCLMGLAM